MQQQLQPAAARRSSYERVGTIGVYHTSINVWEDKVDDDGMRIVLKGVLSRLRTRGFRVMRDPDVAKNYPSIASKYWYGHKREVEVCVECFGRHLKVEFFQEVENVDNRNGGYYVLDKFSKLPRRLRIPFVVEMAAVVEKLLTFGYELTAEQLPPNAWPASLPAAVLRMAEDGPLDDPLAEFNRHWTSDRFRRDHSGWPCESEYASCGYDRDRDGVPMRNGDTRYFRYAGRLQRGTVYTNMNNMWQVRYGGSVTYLASHELFACERPDLEPRRLVPQQEERLKRELKKHVEASNFQRVEALARTLQKLAPRERVDT